MRNASQFSAMEWLRLVPLTQGLRQVRNDLLLSRYTKVRPPQLDAFLADNAHLAGQDIAIVIAFEQPWALDWLLEMARKQMPGVHVLVFDNSRDLEMRDAIAQVCKSRGVPYLGLPVYRTRHANRSHGMAMSWVYENVVRSLKPRSFGYLDHDLIPVDQADPVRRLQQQPVFGLINPGNHAHWSLWAGYCFFRYAETEGRRMNFLYDFSRGLDTGGRNWSALYRTLDRKGLRFANRQIAQVMLPSGEAHDVEFIDDGWLHIGGISYTDGLKRRFSFYEELRGALADGGSWKQLARGYKETAPGR